MALDNCHYDRANRFRVAFPAALAVLAASAMGTLVITLCVQPPLGKWAYFFQWKVWPGREPEPPQNYTGRWRDWDADGRLWSVTTYKGGVRQGLEQVFVPGFPEGVFGEYRNGKKWQGVFFEFRIPDASPCLHPLDLYKEGKIIANVPLDLESVDCQVPSKLVVNTPWHGRFVVTIRGGVVEVEAAAPSKLASESPRREPSDEVFLLD